MKNNLFRRNTAIALTSVMLTTGVVTTMPKQALAESNVNTASNQRLGASLINNTGVGVYSEEVAGLKHGTAIQTMQDSNLQSTGSSIVDLDKTQGKFYALANVENTTNEEQHFIQAIVLPKFYKGSNPDPNKVDVVLDPRQVPETGLSFGLKNEKIQYAIKQGKYRNLDRLARENPGFTWNQIIGIKIDGYLAPKQSFSGKIPLVVANYNRIQDQLTALANNTAEKSIISNIGLRQFSVGQSFYYYKNGEIQTTYDGHLIARVGKEITRLEQIIAQADLKKYQAKTLSFMADGTRVYTSVPADIEKLLPAITAADFIYYNFGSIYPSSPALYTDGIYAIKIRRIFDAIKNDGYSVNIKPNGREIWEHYKYSPASDSNWIIDYSGSDVTPTENPFYVQVQQIFDTKDITINVGENWTNTDNLLKAEVSTYNPSTMALTNQHTLKSDEYKVEDNVDTSKAGVYHVKYSYEINDNDIVTKTAKVTVLDKKKQSNNSSSSASSSSTSSSETSNKHNERSTSEKSSSSASPKKEAGLPQTGTTTIFALVTGLIAIICSILLIKKNKE